MPRSRRSLSPLRDLALNIHDPQPRCWSYEFSDRDEEAGQYDCVTAIIKEQCDKLPVSDAKAKHRPDERTVSPAASSHAIAVTWAAGSAQAFSAPLAPDGAQICIQKAETATTAFDSVISPTIQQRLSLIDSNEERDHLTSLIPSNHWKRRSMSFNSLPAGKPYTIATSNMESLRYASSKLGPLVRSISNLSALEVEASLHSPRECFETRTACDGTFGEKNSAGKSSDHLRLWRSATKISNATLKSSKTWLSSVSRSATSVLSLVTSHRSSTGGLSVRSGADCREGRAQAQGYGQNSHSRTFRASMLSSFSFAYSKGRDSAQWNFLCPDNRSLVQLFPSGHEKLGLSRWITVVVMNPALAALNSLLLSNLFGVGLGQGFFIYEALVRAASVRLPLLGISCSTTFFLHAADWYKWNVHFSLKCVPALLVFYLWIATGACFTREWPFLPLAIAMLHLPLIVMFFRVSQFRMCYTVFFYNAVSISCFIVSMILLGLWLAWVLTADRAWTPRTKDWLQSHMQGLHHAYGVESWNECKEADPRPECAKLELIAFLVWSCPLFQGVTYLVMAGICHFRAWFLSKHEFKQFSIIITFASTVVVILIGAFWVCMSIAGADGEISMAILLIIGVCALSLCAWAYSSLVISDLVEYTSQMPIVMALKPMVNSDEFKGGVLCGAVGLVVPFLFMEMLVRITQRVFFCRSGLHPFLTPRALHLIRGVQGWHWGAVLEQAFAWSVFFVIVWIAGGQLAKVFLVWLREKLFFMHFIPYVFVIVLVTLGLFLLPPIPGMLVYLSTSITIVAKAKAEKSFGTGSGIVVAALSSLFLKMSAFAIEQSIFGRLLRKSMVVQRNWGPRNCWARAIEKIMLEPGLSIKKSLLVCGGPDWPCGVLLGVLPIGTKQPLLHLLPCVVIIVLATISGAWMLDEQLNTVAQIMIRLATMFQGTLMTLACLLVLSVMHDQAEDLQSTRSDLELVNKYVQRNARSTRIYVLCTEWDSLGPVCRFLLVSGTASEILSCWVFFFCSSACFRKFDLNSSFDAPLEENGLGGNVLNVFRPLGVMCLSMAVLGWILVLGYYLIISRRTRQVLQGHEVHHKLANRLQTRVQHHRSLASTTSARDSHVSNHTPVSKHTSRPHGDRGSVKSNNRASVESRVSAMSAPDAFQLLKKPSSSQHSLSNRLEGVDWRDGTASLSSLGSGLSYHRGTPSKVESSVLR